MQRILILVYLLSTILFADLQEQEDLETMNEFYKVLDKSDAADKILILLTGIEQNMLATITLTKKREEFKNGRDNFDENLDIEQLTDFYVDALEGNKEFITIWELLLRVGNEKNILSALKEDLNKNDFSIEEKNQLLDNIEPLIFLDNQCIYDLIVAKNKFYAKHMKEYIDLVRQKRSKDLAFNENSYEDFLYYLNKGENLLVQSVKLNDYKLLEEFVDTELRISEAEKNKFKKSIQDGSMEISKGTSYWIRVQVDIVYALKGSSYFSLTNMIEKQKTFFDELRTSLGSVEE